ncbi:MAG: 1-acyl-sn-glycerol-3-phosphate acyltransferase [Ruminococcus sp.]|nr:1-acyl-sn-glycerol-3-phosphate acyltransferase [Ruminococcus sp.]
MMIVLIIILWVLLGIVALFAAYFLLIAVSSLFVDMNREYDRDSKYFRWLLNSSTAVAVKLIRIHIKVTGKENLPKGRFLLVCNHRSKFDPILSWHIFAKENLSFISKPENFKVPIYGRIIHRCCFMPIDRENPRNAIKTVKRASKLITDDVASVAVYPEGTRNYGKGLLPFHNAMFKIAQKANVPVVVMTVKGTFEIQKNFPLHKSVVNMDVVGVIPVETVKSFKTNELGDMAAEMMTKRLKELEGV